jgi:hypothetical protein
MKRSFCRMALSCLVFVIGAASLSAENDSTRAQRLLVAGIDSISGFGDAYISYMHTFGPEAFAVLGSPNGRPSVSASLFGKGRVLAAGHDAFFNLGRMAEIDQSNIGTFAVNSFRWLAFLEDKKQLSKITLVQNGAENTGKAMFKLKGLSVEVLYVRSFQDADLQAGSGRIAWISADTTDEEQALIKAYVGAGGGALAAMPGWIFGGAEGLKRKGVQKLLFEFGLGLSSEGQTWPEGLNTRNSPLTAWAPVLQYAQALKAPNATANLEALLALQTKALQNIVSVLSDLPRNPPGLGKMAEGFGKAATSFTPLAELDKTPTAEQLAAQFSLFLSDHSDANSLVQASATFPGTLLRGKTRLTESLSLAVDFKAEDLSYLRQPYRGLDFWQSTGLYAPAGQPVTITVPPELEGLSVQIGSHPDMLSTNLLWARDPNVVMRSHLAIGTNTVTSGFGGLIYLVPDKWGYRYRGEMKVSGAVQAPWFQRGKTTLKQWESMLATSVAPWGEITSDQVIFTLPVSALSKIDPEVLTAAWDDNLSAYNALAGLTATAELPHRAPPNPQRYLKDIEISYQAYMYAGYPIHFYDDEQLSTLANPKTQKLWGFWHEMGHNYQQSWTWNGITEVTTNIFSLSMIKHWKEINPWIIPADDTIVFPKLVATGIKSLSQGYFQRTTQEKDYNTSPELEDPFFKLGLFQQLMERYGTSWLTKLYREYRELPEDQLPQTEQQKIDYFVKASATLIGKKKEVLDLYDKWGLHYLAF